MWFSYMNYFHVVLVHSFKKKPVVLLEVLIVFQGKYDVIPSGSTLLKLGTCE